MHPLTITIVGGGPAGLYLSILLKRAAPERRVVVVERNGPHDAYGWGVVFSDQTLANFHAADEPTYRAITERFAHWDDIDIHVHGCTITSSGHGFSGIARRTLLEILQQRAIELGVDLRFHCELRDPAELAASGLGDADLIVAADGVNSAIRRGYAGAFQPSLDLRPNRYIWLGTPRLFDAFTFIFVENEHGVFIAHAYRFDADRSAFIVECDQRSWRNAGFDRTDIDGSVAACEELFAPWLEGQPLLSNVAPHQRAEPWLQFLRVSNERWFHENVVLLGDAAHTAHFSIGSGTKLAMEDAICLANVLDPGHWTDQRASSVQRPASLHHALDLYQSTRKTEALRLQNAARNSMEWFEHVPRYLRLEPEQFAYSLLTRSQRVSHENLRLRDGVYLGGVERWFAGKGGNSGTRERGNEGTGERDSGARNRPEARRADTAVPPYRRTAAPPPMFTPYRLRDLVLPNRIVVSPMDMYSAVDGTPNDFHLVHLGARALGGAGLVMTEMVCVSPEGRITPGCTGMYTEEHKAAWERIAEFVHRWTSAKICLQLGHSGRKGSTKLMWEGMDEPLDDGNWPVMAASPIAYKPGMQVPREMTRAEMDLVRDEFVRATAMAVDAGFDMLELHCAHGYLLSGFLTPVSNRRTDEYGGSLENRLRYPVEVFRAMRAVWPEPRPMSVRISATDWVDDGITGDDAVEIARAFHEAGADIIHVSTGQTAADERPVYGRMFQTPFSDQIRNETGIPTIAVGNITDADQVNSILTAGRADLCALARPHLADPHWTLHAAAELGFAEQPWPVQYWRGKEQLERTIQRMKQGGR